MEFHPVTEIFPLIEGDEFNALVDDIKANGLREPIYTYQGKIVDGRNRHRACKKAGVPGRYRQWDGEGSLVQFVLSMNLHRRHLTTGQKAAVAVEMLPFLEKEKAKLRKEGQRLGGKTAGRGRPKPKSVGTDNSITAKERGSYSTKERKPTSAQDAGKLVGVGSRSVEEAKRIQQKAPDLLEKVKKGEMTLPQAKQQVRKQEKRQQLQERAAARAEPNDDGEEQQEAPSWEVINGDCLVELRKLKANSARLIFADPPYNIGVDYGEGTKKDKLPEFDFWRWCAEWMKECHRALTADGSFWALINHENAAMFELLLNGTLVVTDKTADGFVDSSYDGMVTGHAPFHIRSWVTWYETFGVNCTDKFNRATRRLFYCVKNPKKFVFNADAVSRPSDRQVKYNDARANPEGKLLDDCWFDIPRLAGTHNERIPDFPTQLPIALLERIVGCASEPGDLVVDPFNGSGTTGAACIRLGREYKGIEKSKKFAKLATLRLKGESNGR